MAHGITTIVPVAILCGMSSGAFVALIGAPAAKMGGPTSVGERTGLLFSFTALGALFGPPISGAIRKSSGNWESVGYYAGTCALLHFLQ
jgi:MCP family monocarboxylic acid transporter-like MFS transporter 10